MRGVPSRHGYAGLGRAGVRCRTGASHAAPPRSGAVPCAASATPRARRSQALPEGRPMNRRLLAALGSAALMLGLILPGAATAAPRPDSATKRFTESGIYIVQLRELPTVAYNGSTKGFAATKPAAGKKLNMASTAVTRYVAHLVAKHDAEIKAAGGHKVYDYSISYNGFAAKLTAAQANKLAVDKDVVAISKQRIETVDTSSTPAFLGLSAPGGLWDQLGGVGKAGENIIIGDIDSGIWPEALSFSDRVDSHGTPSNAPSAKRAYQNLPGVNFKCQGGE